ncbi:MAG: biopolymer transporter ExbD [Kofleriaceae bacterium]
MAGRAGHQHRRWRISAKKNHVDHVRNDINVTPLVDVMLVLLIIFMLMTMVMGRGKDVTLPKARNFSQEKDKMQPIVSIDNDGNLYVEKNKLGQINDSTLKEMEIQIKAAWDAPKNPEGVGRVYIKAADLVEYGKIKPVIVYLNKSPVLALQQLDLAIAKSKDSGEK